MKETPVRRLCFPWCYQEYKGKRKLSLTLGNLANVLLTLINSLTLPPGTMVII